MHRRIISLLIALLIPFSAWAVQEPEQRARQFNYSQLNKSIDADRVAHCDPMALADPRIPAEKLFNGYQLLGNGTFGRVVKVTDLRGNVFALKEYSLPDDVRETIKKHGVDPEDYLQYLLEEEWKTSVVLDSDWFMKVYHCFIKLEDNGCPYRYYVLMEYISGVTLTDLWLDHVPTSDDDALRLMEDFVLASQEVLAAGLVPDDLYGDNVMIDADGRLRWIDMGGFTGQFDEDSESAAEYLNRMLSIIHLFSHLLHDDGIRKAIIEATYQASDDIAAKTDQHPTNVTELPLVSQSLGIVLKAVLDQRLMSTKRAR